MSDPTQNSTDLSRLGLDPSAPFQPLNLAGSDGWPPDPLTLAQPYPVSTPAQLPDYTAPDMTSTALRPYDLQLPAIIYHDSLAPDLPVSYNTPYSVDRHDSLQPSPVIAQDIPSDSEIAASLYPGLGFPMLTVIHTPDGHDLGLAYDQLQHPQLTPDVQMDPEDRPGDLDDDALDVMAANAANPQTDEDDYPQSQMNARGNNSTRARHMALLTDGLEDD